MRSRRCVVVTYATRPRGEFGADESSRDQLPQFPCDPFRGNPPRIFGAALNAVRTFFFTTVRLFPAQYISRFTRLRPVVPLLIVGARNLMLLESAKHACALVRLKKYKICFKNVHLYFVQNFYQYKCFFLCLNRYEKKKIKLIVLKMFLE